MTEAAIPATRPAEKQRSHWMDLVRGAAILLVITFHAAALPAILTGVPPSEFIDDVNAFFSPYRMSTLLILSGMLLSRSLAKPAGVYYSSKVRTLVWPYLLWAVIYWIVSEQDGWMDPSTWFATSWLWFLSYLTLYYAAAPLLTRIRGAWFALVPVALWVASAYLPSGEATEIPYYGGFFFAGHFIASNKEWIRRRFETTPVLLVALSIALVFSLLIVAANHDYYFGLAPVFGIDPAAVENWQHWQRAIPASSPWGFLTPLGTLEGGIYRYDVLWVPLVLVGVSGIIMLVRRTTGALDGRSRDSGRWLQHIGRNSVVFYVVHYPVQIWLSYRLGDWGQTDPTVTLLVCILGALAVSCALTWLRRYPIVDALFVFPELRRRHAPAVASEPASAAAATHDESSSRTR